MVFGLEQVAALALWGAWGVTIFLYLFNRHFLQARESPRRRGTVAVALLGIGALCSAGALFSGLGPGSWVPVAGLGLAVLREIWSLHSRRRHRTPPPVRGENTKLSWRRPITTLDLALRHYRVPAPLAPGRRIRVAHVTDLHVSDRLPAAYFQHVFDRVDAEQPDLVFCTGDFLSREEHFALLPPVLARMRAPLGAYAILGNHDLWLDPERVERALCEAGIRPVRGAPVRVALDAAHGVVLAGCEAPWATPWVKPALAPGERLLVLSHTADPIYEFARDGVLAVFTGHFHAGQLRLPGFGAVAIPSRHGRRFDHGHFCVDGTHLFVSAGIGAYSPPLRLYCKPELLIVDFE